MRAGLRCAWAAVCASACGRPIPAAVPEATTYVYECGGGMSVVARIEPASAWVALPVKTVQLLPVQAESGARYEGDGVLLWITSEQDAILDVDGRRFGACTGGRYDDAPLPRQVF